MVCAAVAAKCRSCHWRWVSAIALSSLPFAELVHTLTLPLCLLGFVDFMVLNPDITSTLPFLLF